MNETSQFGQNQIQCKCRIAYIHIGKNMKVRNSETLISQTIVRQRTRPKQKCALSSLKVILYLSFGVPVTAILI